MDHSQDGMPHGGDFQRQSGSKHIVNFQGPFYQRGSNEHNVSQQKSVSAATAGPVPVAEHDEKPIVAAVMKNAQRSSFGGEGAKIPVENTFYNRSEQAMSVQHMVPVKHLVDDADEEDEDDDGEVDPSVNISSSEQTGRWTRKEHEVFLEALKKFGKVCVTSLLSHS